MSKEKIIIIGFGFLILLFAFFAIKKIKSLNEQITEQKEQVAKSHQRLEYVKDLEESLEERKMSGKVLVEIPRAQDPIANKVLMRKFMKAFLLRLGLEAEVEIENERKSRDFPDMVTVNEVPLKIGIKNYSSYDQVIKMLKEFKQFPFAVEILTIGGTDVPVSGNLRVQLKYYFVPGGS
ncbi:MAG: hypothetical protein AMJ91_04280 [candidate division Zixibacteria bacterium SM23_73_3]|nr:MAG: hypothetical protein AMJ91_04280 [candidate division Zixibacteria bacterium SM23_73_3]